jgi:hypothetical protein
VLTVFSGALIILIDARSGSTFTTKGDLDAQGEQSCLHPPQAAGECAGISGPTGARSRDTVTGKVGLGTAAD